MGSNADLMGWKPSDHSPECWDGQAALALEYANERPASDLKGFLAALRDSAAFERLASLARAGTTA